MNKTLNIEISYDEEVGVDELLNHIIKEITENDKYLNFDIENNTRLENGWLVVNTKTIKGKYRWSKTSI